MEDVRSEEYFPAYAISFLEEKLSLKRLLLGFPENKYTNNLLTVIEFIQKASLKEISSSKPLDVGQIVRCLRSKTIHRSTQVERISSIDCLHQKQIKVRFER